MIVVNRETEYTASLSLPSDPDNDAVEVSLIHALGGVIKTDTATKISTGNYEYTFTSDSTKSGGVHKILWTYDIVGTETTKTDFITIIQPYISSFDFFSRNSYLEAEFEDSFSIHLRKVMGIIDTICGQSFYPIYNQTITADGSGRQNLYLGIKINSFSLVNGISSDVSGSVTTDLTDYVERIPNVDRFIRMKSSTQKFGEESEIQITGNFGWEWVPSNITEATDILIQDSMNDDSAYVKHGAKSAYMDALRMDFDDRIYHSTGNFDADALILDYIIFEVGLV